MSCRDRRGRRKSAAAQPGVRLAESRRRRAGRPRDHPEGDMKRSWLVIACLILVGVGSIACGPGSGSGPGPSSGLPRSSTFADLTTDQVGILCDWINERQGGYGRHVSCPDGSTQDTDANKSECVGAAPVVASYCPALTVADVEDCTNAVLTDLCSLPNQAACANLNACLATAMP
jgi:hypothetical protein